nr:MAG TPA: hypothetical protein [Caudoviricetes sp.]
MQRNPLYENCPPAFQVLIVIGLLNILVRNTYKVLSNSVLINYHEDSPNLE